MICASFGCWHTGDVAHGGCTSKLDLVGSHTRQKSSTSLSSSAGRSWPSGGSAGRSAEAPTDRVPTAPSTAFPLGRLRFAPTDAGPSRGKVTSHGDDAAQKRAALSNETTEAGYKERVRSVHALSNKWSLISDSLLARA